MLGIVLSLAFGVAGESVVACSGPQDAWLSRGGGARLVAKVQDGGGAVQLDRDGVSVRGAGEVLFGVGQGGVYEAVLGYLVGVAGMYVFITYTREREAFFKAKDAGWPPAKEATCTAYGHWY